MGTTVQQRPTTKTKQELHVNLKFKKEKVASIARLRKLLDYTENHVCVIGIWDRDGSKSSPHISYRELAVIHEYGIDGRIPARPFLAPAMKKKEKSCLKMYRDNLHQFLRARLPLEVVYTAPAMMMVEAIQGEFGSSNMAELSKRTIQKRTKGGGQGTPKPLLDHGNLQASVSFEVLPIEEVPSFVAL